MKRTGNLKHIWCNYETLLRAFSEVKKNKSFHQRVVEYESNIVTKLNNLLERLDNGSYAPKKPREFYVYEPKKRLIHAPQLEDRIVHHALLMAVRTIIEDRFIHFSFACRKERGTHRASDIVKSWLKSYQDNGYYLKIDISKYFYSIDHIGLLNQMERIIKCKDTLKLIEKFITGNSTVGLPLGNVTSQLFANLTLNNLDHFIKRVLKAKHYIRYMDDLLILHNCKETLKSMLEDIISEIYKHKLKINSKTKIGKINEGIDFVGYRTWHNRRIIRKRTLYNIKRKLKKDSSIERISSFLSHSKRTDSIMYVVKKVIEVAGEQHVAFVEKWVKLNRGDKYHEIFCH